MLQKYVKKMKRQKIFFCFFITRGHVVDEQISLKLRKAL